LDMQDRAVELAYNHILWKVMERLDDGEGQLAVGVVAPIFWRAHSKPTWDGMHHAYSLARKYPVQRLFFSEYVPGLGMKKDRIHLVPRAGRKYVELVHEFFKKIDHDLKLNLVHFESPDLTMTLTPDLALATGHEEEDEDEDMDMDEAGMEATLPTETVSPARTLSNVSPSMLRSMSGVNPISLNPGSGFGVLTGSNAISLAPAAHPFGRQLFTVPPPRGPPTATSSAHQQPPPPPTTWPTMLTPELSTSLARIEERIGALERKSLQDNIMMAALQEDQDAEANRTMLDRLTISGIQIQNIRRMKDIERNPLMRTKVEEAINMFKEEDLEFQIAFIRHLNRQARKPDDTVLEVRFKDSKQAASVRSSYIKKKDDPTLDGLFITPTVRLATRVRVEVLQAIARLVKKEDSTVTKTQCVQFIPKPILKVFRKDSNGSEYFRTMTFIDSVVWVKENDVEKKLDLTKAYRRAGAAFKGILAQNFVIMS